MKIIIVGATIVGTELAEYLVQAGNAVTLIDEPSEELSQIGNRLDLRVVQGDPTWPSVLREAGARNTELIVATAPSNEKNIAVCSVASALFNVPRKIARIRSESFLNEAEKLFGPDAIPIDHIIAPEHLIADDVINLIELPGVTAVQNFAQDRLIVASVVCQSGGKFIGRTISDFEENAGGKCKVLAIYRNGALSTRSDNLVTIDDEIFFCCERSRALSIIGALTPLKPNGKNVVIEGGSHIADELALRLSERYHVKLIEPDPKRAAKIASNFKGSSVEIYNADALNLDFVIEEKLYQSDLFIAASPSEETNIMASMMVQRFEKVRTLAVLRKPSLQDMALASKEIDAIVSPRESIISALLSNIRQDGMEKMRIFRQGAAEALELTVQGTKRSSNVVGRKLIDINLPKDVTLGLVIRNKRVLKIDENFLFEEGDLVIAFLKDRNQMRALVKLFKPRAFWFPKW